MPFNHWEKKELGDLREDGPGKPDKHPPLSPGQIASGQGELEDEAMTRAELQKLYAEWREDYAARRAEDANPQPRLPSPGQIAEKHASGQAEPLPADHAMKRGR